jgi:alginate O-acetyltransferase complex protein AlgJ
MPASRKLDLLLIAGFVILLAIPGATGSLGLWGGDSIGTRELRKRSDWPGLPRDLTALRRWPVEVQSWFDDRFGLRDQLIVLHNAAKALIRVSPSDKAIIGRDGWLFIEQSYLTEANRGVRPFTPGQLDLLVEHFVSFQQRLHQAGIEYLHFTPPDKQSLYADFLPSRIRFIAPSRYEHWREAAALSPLRFIDVYPALQRARDTGEFPYMQTDSHWNCRGAFVAYEQVMAGLQETFARPLRVLSRSEVDFERYRDPRGRDLARNVIGVPSLFPENQAMRCAIADASELAFFDLKSGKTLQRRELDVAPRATRVVNRDFPDGARALVLRDSFGNAMIDFFNHSFAEVIYLYRLPGPPSDERIAELAPDVVIYEHVERSLVPYALRVQRSARAAAQATVP